MSDQPINIPEYPISEEQLAYCSSVASKKFQVNPYVIQAIAKIEGGKVGTISTNTNGTYDLGIMQLNTVNLKRIQKQFPKVTAWDLVLKPCVNIYVATWFLSEEIRLASGNVIKGIGNYHSRTPKFHNRYLERFNKAYRQIIQKQISKLRNAK